MARPRRAGLDLIEVPVPEVGPNDVLIRITEDRDLRHRHPHLELGPVGAAHRSRADVTGHEFCGEIVESAPR